MHSRWLRTPCICPCSISIRLVRLWQTHASIFNDWSIIKQIPDYTIVLVHCSIYNSISGSLIEICRTNLVWICINILHIVSVYVRSHISCCIRILRKLQLLAEWKIIIDPKFTKVILVQIHSECYLSLGTWPIYTYIQPPLLENVAQAEVGQAVTGGPDLWLLLSPVLFLALSPIYPQA